MKIRVIILYYGHEVNEVKILFNKIFSFHLLSYLYIKLKFKEISIQRNVYIVYRVLCIVTLRYEMVNMKCVRCGMVKRGDKDFFICEDCLEFSGLVKEIRKDIENTLTNYETIDPETSPILRLLADSSFITSQNPQTRIFYNICAVLVEKALHEENELTEEELNRKVRTTRGWSDALKVFEDLGLIEVKVRKFSRVLIFKDKLKKFAKQYLVGEPFTKQLTIRLAHIYAGYILFHILSEVAELNEEFEVKDLPYHQRPRTLWVILMYLWREAYHDHETFSEEDMRKFIARRGISSTTRGQIMQSLTNVNGKTVQGLIKDIRIEDGNRIFHFDDYIMVEMERIRTLVRERGR